MIQNTEIKNPRDGRVDLDVVWTTEFADKK